MKQKNMILFSCVFTFILFSHEYAASATNMTVRKDISVTQNTQANEQISDTPENKLANHPPYVLANALLNATIDLLETRITPEQHKRLSQWQKKWTDGEQAAEVAKLSKTMSTVEAYTKATEERNAVLLRIAAVVPSAGTYNGKSSSFSISSHDGTLTVQGSAHNAQGQACTFQGIGALNKGWIQVSNQAENDFYVLFTPKAAYIYYSGSDVDMNCPEGASFKGDYVKQ